MNLIDKLVSILGGNAYQAAQKLGVSRPTIVYWRGKGFIPVRYAGLIAEKTEGKITEGDVRRLAASAISGIL